jgi:hypothetical protein
MKLAQLMVALLGAVRAETRDDDLFILPFNETNVDET